MRLLISLLSTIGLSRLADAFQHGSSSDRLGSVRVDVDRAIEDLLADEDVNNDLKITVDDLRVGSSGRGDKVHTFHDVHGHIHSVRGTYFLSNLLQELSLAREQHVTDADIHWQRIHEPPVERISRLIRERFWSGLTRRIDAVGLEHILADDKAGNPDRRLHLYVPAADASALAFYRHVIGARPSIRVDLHEVPSSIDVAFLSTLEGRHGLLALAYDTARNGTLEPLPFVVPGGRFNELYGWDSYFEILGLLRDGLTEVSRAMVDHFVYEIRHYGKVLNANRTYYLTRSQPPFLTSMLRAVMPHLEQGARSHAWLRRSLIAAIREYRTVWTGPDRLMSSGLSRYWDEGSGPPPEVEEGHFREVFAEFAAKHAMSPQEFERAYLSQTLSDPDLDRYFKDDRAMRESGHDTSYRLVGRASSLSTVDLNALLYKTESDIAVILEEYFGGVLTDQGTEETADSWRARAARRKALMDSLQWDPGAGMFFDWNEVRRAREPYVAPTTFYPLWAGSASQTQADRIVASALPQLEMPGGLAGSSAESRGPVGEGRQQRQWDYPYGWAPHQILAWHGLIRYGYRNIADRLIYRWLYTITRNAVDYNGTIPEKYDVVRRTHDVFAEYGNVGVQFAYITREGFGWMNASYQVGLGLLSQELRGELEELRTPEEVFGR